MLQPWFPVENLKINYLCENTHPRAIEIIEKIYDDDPETNTLNWTYLCANPSAMNLLIKEHNICPNQINWTILSRNPSAIPLLFGDIYSRYYIDWKTIWANPSAINILEKKEARKYQLVEYYELSRNPNGIPLLLNLQKTMPYSIIDWNKMSSNPSHLAIDLLKENPDKICWSHLSGNPSAMPLIFEAFENERKGKTNPVKWTTLCTNPSAINLLYEESLLSENRLNWNSICRNPNATTMIYNAINNTPEKINWYCLSSNPCIFQNEDFDIK